MWLIVLLVIRNDKSLYLVWSNYRNLGMDVKKQQKRLQVTSNLSDRRNGEKSEALLQMGREKQIQKIKEGG